MSAQSSRAGRVLVLATFLIAFLYSPTARAAVIYDWTGVCGAGCTGTATAVLTLNDSYTPGTALAGVDFVSWTYASTSGSYAIPADAAFSDITGTLPVTSGSSVVDVAINFGASFDTFETEAIGVWISRFTGPPVIFDLSNVTHNWELRAAAVPVPEPSTLILFATGLAGLGLMMRRRRKA